MSNNGFCDHLYLLRWVDGTVLRIQIYLDLGALLWRSDTMENGIYHGHRSDSEYVL
jgi:hypothetical protein